MAKCVNCGKEEDVEWVHNGYFINSDGDYVCSRRCEIEWWESIRQAVASWF